MKKIKTTFTLSEDVLEMLKRRIPKRNRSLFVQEAIRFKFEHEQFLKELVVSNRVQGEELDLIDAGLMMEDPASSDDESLTEGEFLELEELL
jgi:hypothetical protein